MKDMEEENDDDVKKKIEEMNEKMVRLESKFKNKSLEMDY